MVIFSHRGIGFGRKENSLEAVAIALKKGYSVEVDLRLRGDKIILTHDTNQDIENDDFGSLLKMIKDNPGVYFALHIKENSEALFKGLSAQIQPFKNCLLFATDFKQDSFIQYLFKRIGREYLGLYVQDKNIDLALADKVSYFWLDETKENLYADLEYFLRFNKKIICCSPEIFKDDYKEKLEAFRSIRGLNKITFGICTDFVDSGLEKENRCPVCGSAGPFDNVEQVDDYTMLRCKFCYLEFTKFMCYDPVYYEHLHYADDYNLDNIRNLPRDKFLEKAGRLLNKDNWQPYNLVFQWIDKNFKHGTLVLDVGCGSGWFIAALESRGFKTIGIEVSTKVVAMLKRKGFQVFLGPLENINAKISSPDLVVLLGVIEHVDNPVGLLKDIHKRFPRAVLLISIPSPRRWDSSLGIHNYWDYPPNHITPIWPEGALKIALDKAAFTLNDWLFPQPTTDEIWLVFIEQLLTKLRMRKKGYFIGLTNKAVQDGNLLKMAVRLFYPVFKGINYITKYVTQPLLNHIARQFKRRGYSGLSAVAIAYPEKIRYADFPVSSKTILL